MEIDFIMFLQDLVYRLNDLHIPWFVKEVVDTMSNYSQKYFNTVDCNSAKRSEGIRCNINGIKVNDFGICIQSKNDR